MSPEAAQRLKRWLIALPDDPPDDLFHQAMNAWERGEEPPVRTSAFPETEAETLDRPTLLAVPAQWTFLPKECTTEHLEGLLSGKYDGMNGPLSRPERDQAKAELARRKKSR